MIYFTGRADLVKQLETICSESNYSAGRLTDEEGTRILAIGAALQIARYGPQNQTPRQESHV